MVIERPEFINKKDIVLINDVPVKSEISNELPYSATSNLNLFKALRRGTVDSYNNEAAPNPYPIKQRDIHATYLDYTYYGEGEVENNWDYTKEICKRKDLEQREDSLYNGETKFYQLPHQKDVYVAERVWNNIHALLEEIGQAKPKIIVLTGKWSLFFLTGLVSLTTTQSKAGKQIVFGGIATYRASILRIHECWGITHECIIYPIYHPVHVITMPDKLYMMDLDIQKLCYMYEVIKTQGVGYYIRPDKELLIGDSRAKIFEHIDAIIKECNKKPTFVSIDIETFFSSTIDCIGITTSTTSGMCIPFATKTNPCLWGKEAEVEILYRIYELFTHPNCLHIGQNYQYELQFYYKLWKLDIKVTHDTMVLAHILHNKIPKDLAFLASMYCDVYTFWKDMQQH